MIDTQEPTPQPPRLHLAPYRVTTVRPNPNALELAATVAHALPDLKWRHHAVGMLQAYLVEDRDPEVRVHLWHPDLVRTDLAIDGGRPHDHRFDMRSTVLHGAVGHEELHVSDATIDAGGDAAPVWVEYTVQHARAGAAPLVPTGWRLRAERVAGVIRAGMTYEFPAGEYHRSTIRDGLAVTLVTKHAQRSFPARVLFPEGCPAVFGVHPAADADVARFVEEARAALLAPL